MYSASMDGNATTFCFFHNHVTTPDLIVKTTPVVLFPSIGLVPQSLLEKPFKRHLVPP